MPSTDSIRFSEILLPSRVALKRPPSIQGSSIQGSSMRGSNTRGSNTRGSNTRETNRRLGRTLARESTRAPRQTFRQLWEAANDTSDRTHDASLLRRVPRLAVLMTAAIGIGLTLYMAYANQGRP